MFSQREAPTPNPHPCVLWEGGRGVCIEANILYQSDRPWNVGLKMSEYLVQYGDSDRLESIDEKKMNSLSMVIDVRSQMLNFY